MRRGTYATGLRCTDYKHEQQCGKPICIQYFRRRKKDLQAVWAQLNVRRQKWRHPESPRFHQRAEGSPNRQYVLRRSLAPLKKGCVRDGAPIVQGI